MMADSLGPGKHGGKTVKKILGTHIGLSCKNHDSKTVEKLAFSIFLVKAERKRPGRGARGGKVVREMMMIAFTTLK